MDEVIDLDGTTCPVCGKVCASMKGLKMHFTGQHEELKRGNQFPWEAEGDVECPTCGRLCANEAGMRRHHKWEHDESIAKATLVCDHCGRERETFKSKAERLNSGFCKECIENEDLGDDHPSSRERSQHVIEAVREAHKGKEMSQERLEKLWAGYREWYENGGAEEISEAQRGNSPNMTEEVKQQISETLMGHEVSEETRQKIRENSSPGRYMTIEVEETGHTVRSHWEEEVDLMLYNAGIDYEFEPRTFELEDRNYLPDFIVDDIVVEVKGWANDHSIERAEQFLRVHSEWTYLVLGSELPCDIHIEWENREELLEFL